MEEIFSPYLDAHAAEICYEISVKKHNFSDEAVHRPGQQSLDNTECSIDQIKELNCNFEVFANGDSEDNKGYVSIVLNPVYVAGNNDWCGVSFLISAVDVFGEQTCSRSFVFDDVPDEYSNKKVVDRFIARQRLLDSAELLPDDTLTLLIALRFVLVSPRIYLSGCNFDVIQDCFSFEEIGSELLIHLHLDSSIGRCFCRESLYFREALETPMLEKSTGRILIHENEFEDLTTIADMLTGQNKFRFKSVKELVDLYLIADKYIFTTVQEICNVFLKLYLSVNGAEEVLKLHDEYAHCDLEKMIKSLSCTIIVTQLSQLEYRYETKIIDCELIFKFTSDFPTLYFEIQKAKLNDISDELGVLEFFEEKINRPDRKDSDNACSIEISYLN